VADDGTEAQLRRDARALLAAALAAADPAALVERALRDRPLTPGRGGKLIVLAIGKAALAMAEGASRVLGGRIGRGVVLMPAGVGGTTPSGFDVHRGGHPLPNSEGMDGARAIAEAARQAGPADRLLVLLSGGGSALLTMPAGEVTLEDVREVTRLLLDAGAPIDELNTVRKHFDELKGGGLARVAMPAPVRALVISDVIGDPLDVIASGPLSPDPTTFADAIEVLEQRGIWERVSERVRRHLGAGRGGRIPESPKPGDPPFAGVEVEVVGSVSHAVAAAAETGRSLGYRTHILGSDLSGEARAIGRRLAGHAWDVRRLSRPVAPPAALIAGGETTVTVRGEGRGGRNQEVALGAALDLEDVPGVLVMSAGTDGVDGPTDAAGALATGSTLGRARGRGLDPADHLERNDAYPFFDALGDLVRTGPTGTNVMDVMIVLVAS
jgi:glycerate 2-kinase